MAQRYDTIPYTSLLEVNNDGKWVIADEHDSEVAELKKEIALRDATIRALREDLNRMQELFRQSMGIR